MDREQLAKDLAQVLLKHEPKKARDGSPQRQAWLRIVLQCHLEMLELGVGTTFKKAMLE